MLIGEYQHTIDTKKRLAIPAKFRKDLGEQAIVTKGLENCLVIYTLVEWEKQAKKLEALPPTQIDARNYARLMLSGAADAVLDKLGRILVPDYLKNYQERESGPIYQVRHQLYLINWAGFSFLIIFKKECCG